MCPHSGYKVSCCETQTTAEESARIANKGKAEMSSAL